MSSRIRFHLDENIDSDVAKALRRQEIDVTTTVSMRLIGQPDEVRLAFACNQGRVIITHDTDFLKLASQTTDHWGIIGCGKNYLPWM
ncbi:MAG: DUF5615 family PIN-like protein [Rhizonema sp. NSF051]|nr:DUF5615 family PIN-like protein [Rhizonema sp. NSF051]